MRASPGDASGAEPAGATFDRTLLAAGEASLSGRREARYVDRFKLLRKLGEGGMGIVTRPRLLVPPRAPPRRARGRRRRLQPQAPRPALGRDHSLGFVVAARRSHDLE